MQHVRLECGKEPHEFCTYCNYKSHRASHLYRHLRSVHKLEVNINEWHSV